MFNTIYSRENLKKNIDFWHFVFKRYREFDFGVAKMSSALMGGPWIGEILIFGDGFFSYEPVIESKGFSWNSYVSEVAEEIKHVKKSRMIKGFAYSAIRKEVDYNMYRNDAYSLETCYLCLNEPHATIFTSKIDMRQDIIDEIRSPRFDQVDYYVLKNLLGPIMRTIGF